jgi:glycosyltransferase involved in cell wall biosynthesis
MTHAKPTWIAWETQRRSQTLSRSLGYRLCIFEHERLGWFRYPWSALRTLALLVSERPSLVVVQNPSMVLAALACACKRALGFSLVVDRHSNFLLSPRAAKGAKGWKRRLFLALSRYSIRNADITIVTNPEIAARVARESGRPFILPDPYPDLDIAPRPPGRAVANVVFVCSWADDEPIREMMEAAAELRGEIVMHVTGRPKAAYSGMLDGRTDNFRPTGFLSDAEYFRLLAEADAVAVLTTQPSTLVCGAYEGLAMGKPLLLSGSEVLRRYFSAGAVHLENHRPREIAAKLRQLLARRRELRDSGLIFLELSRAAWRTRHLALRRTLAEISRPAF